MHFVLSWRLTSTWKLTWSCLSEACSYPYELVMAIPYLNAGCCWPACSRCTWPCFCLLKGCKEACRCRCFFFALLPHWRVWHTVSGLRALCSGRCTYFWRKQNNHLMKQTEMLQKVPFFASHWSLCLLVLWMFPVLSVFWLSCACLAACVNCFFLL